MSQLIYFSIASLDGYVNDATGSFEWAAPDAEVHQFANDLMRGIGTQLYGRRLYEVMRFWASPIEPTWPEEMQDFARVWQATDKVVHSTTLETVDTPRTLLVPIFDPAAVSRLVEESELDVSIGGPGLAAQALQHGLVDEIQVIHVPSVIGGGTPYLPVGLRTDLTLLDHRSFSSGAHYLRYAVQR